MRVFLAEDNLCAQNLLRLVSHGNAILAEILRLKDNVPKVFYLDTKELLQQYQDNIMDFSYFKISDVQEKKIMSNIRLYDLDDDLKEKHLELITRFYLLFENLYQYIVDLNSFVEQLHDGAFIQQTIETIIKDIEGKQLLCESLYLYGAMLLLCDLYIPGVVRERLLVAFYRYSTNQSQSNVDDVCKLLRDTGYDQLHGKRPLDYPVEYFSRIPIHSDFIEKVVGKLRSEDIYNQLSVYTIPEHQASALATQASMLVVCLFFTPNYLHSDTVKMREIVDKFFPCNWIIPVYMGVTMNVVDYWENFKAARISIHNTCNLKSIKDIYSKRGNSVDLILSKICVLLKEGTLNDEFVLDNINKILNVILNANHVIRWLILHNNDVIFFDNNKKSRHLRDLVIKESNYNPLKLLELLVSTAEIELKIREYLKRLLDSRSETWNTNKNIAMEAVNNLSELFTGSQPFTKVSENEKLTVWFQNIAKQISSLEEPITSKSVKKVTQLIRVLEDVEEFHGIKSTSTVFQYLSESKDALKNLLRAALLKEDSLITLETVADFSYAWCTIDLYTIHMQNNIKKSPDATSKLRALFLKLASAMEIPLLRINQAQSDDLVSVSQYYSKELINYIQKVLQIIPEMVFSIVEKIIDLQTWTIKELPTRIDKERLREYAQMDERMEVAKLTHSVSTFTTGILDMRSTLVGVIRVDPAELLEEGLLKELDRHINKKFIEFLEPQPKKSASLESRLQKLAESMDGYKRSLEYIQDYINIHGLRIWQKQVSAIINQNVTKEISLRKGVSFYGPSAGFMGSLARQITQIVDSRASVYINVCAAWYDSRTHKELLNTKSFASMGQAIGAVGLHGLDSLYGHMLKNQLQQAQRHLRGNQDKVPQCRDLSDVEQTVLRHSKLYQTVTDIVVLVGTLQLLRKHIAYQLNTSCKFDSAHLESSLRTLNESLLNEIRTSNSSVPLELLRDVDEYSMRCGISEPYEKVYVRPGHFAPGVGRLLAAALVSQLGKLQLCATTGDLVNRKAGDNIDGCPLLVGCYTLLRQSQTDAVEDFLDLLCKYAKVLMFNKLKTLESNADSVLLIRVLQMFCETFEYPFSKLEDKLPLSLLTQNLTIK